MVFSFFLALMITPSGINILYLNKTVLSEIDIYPIHDTHYMFKLLVEKVNNKLSTCVIKIK